MVLRRDIKRILNNFYILKLRELRHRICYKNSCDSMKKAIKRYKLCKDKKPRLQILREIKLCKRYWGCYPLHYFRYELYKRNKTSSQEDLLDYIPEFFFYSIFLPYYDSKKYSILTEDKNMVQMLFNSSNIVQPNTIFRLIDNKFYDVNYNIIKFEDIVRKLKTEEINRIFMKPIDGGGGYGIFVFHDYEGEYYTKNGEHFNEELLKLLGMNNDYIFQEGINQAPAIAQIYSESVNTFRIATVNTKGKSNLICATLRIGKDKKEIDNGTQGGIVLGIDIQTGRCMDYGITETGKQYHCHPNTGFVFKDFQIEGWDEIRKFAIECSNKLPHFTYLGWDIALTENGLVVIETNQGFGIDHYQVPLGGLRKIFGIEDPMLYWKELQQ